MAKKNIISDFSALKGKVTFSEKTSDTKMSPKVTPSIVIQKSKTSDDGLKVGQSVVLMDSDLRGKIIGLCKGTRERNDLRLHSKNRNTQPVRHAILTERAAESAIPQSNVMFSILRRRIPEGV